MATAADEACWLDIRVSSRAPGVAEGNDPGPGLVFELPLGRFGAGDVVLPPLATAS